MMGWGIAIVLMIERGVPWGAAIAAALLGRFAEFVAQAAQHGINQARKDATLAKGTR